MVGNSDLMDYAKKFLGLEVTQDISQDLSQIGDIYSNRALLSTIDFKQHPLLIKAKEWWDAKEK